MNELLGGVKDETELEKTRPYKIIKPDPGMYLLFFVVFFLFLLFCYLLCFVRLFRNLSRADHCVLCVRVEFSVLHIITLTDDDGSYVILCQESDLSHTNTHSICFNSNFVACFSSFGLTTSVKNKTIKVTNFLSFSLSPNSGRYFLNDIFNT